MHARSLGRHIVGTSRIRSRDQAAGRTSQFPVCRNDDDDDDDDEMQFLSRAASISNRSACYGDNSLSFGDYPPFDQLRQCGHQVHARFVESRKPQSRCCVRPSMLQRTVAINVSEYRRRKLAKVGKAF